MDTACSTIDVNLYFATNRNHEGSNRWQPDGYGTGFSRDGHDNLRFGRLSLPLNAEQVRNYIEGDYKGRSGDGVSLASWVAKQASQAEITAFQDNTFDSSEPLSEHQNASVSMFREMKGLMESGADVLAYIHGFNVSWESAVGDAVSLQLMLNHQLQQQYQQQDTPEEQRKGLHVMLFSWPSNGREVPWKSYASDRSDARGSGEAVGRALLKLRDFFTTLRRDAEDPQNRECGQALHLLCHSMGNYVLQNAVQKVQLHSAGQRLPRIFDNIFLCAADVDDDVMEAGEGFARLPELTRSISIYKNHDDGALIISDYTKGCPDRLGHHGLARPQQAHHKIQQIDCTEIVGRDREIQHSYYLWASPNQDIAQTILGLKNDAQQRDREKTSTQFNLWKLR